MEKTIEIQSA